MSDQEEGGLKLPANIGAPARTPVTTKIHETWDTLPMIQQEIANRGFSDGPRPLMGEFPNLTAEDLTTSDSRTYTTRYAEFLAWWRYCSEQLAVVKAHELQLKNEMEDIELDVRRNMKGQKGTGRGGAHSKDDIEMAVGMHPRRREVLILSQRVAQTRMLLDTRLEYLEKSLRLISRQVEIRRLDIEQGLSENGMPRRGQPQQQQTSPSGLPPPGQRWR